MPIIRPVSDLRNKTPEIKEICIKEQKPVFITKNGNWIPSKKVEQGERSKG